MKRVKNKTGIVMYWELAKDTNKVNILDSRKNYFNDLYYECEDSEQDIKDIVEMLENTDLQNMCDFFWVSRYDTVEELIHYEDLYDYDENTVIDNDYVNVFIVNNSVQYTWGW